VLTGNNPPFRWTPSTPCLRSGSQHQRRSASSATNHPSLNPTTHQPSPPSSSIPTTCGQHALAWDNKRRAGEDGRKMELAASRGSLRTRSATTPFTGWPSPSAVTAWSN